MENILKLLEKVDSNPTGWEAVELWFALILLCCLMVAIVYVLGLALAFMVGNVISHFQERSQQPYDSNFKDRPDHGPKY